MWDILGKADMSLELLILMKGLVSIDSLFIAGCYPQCPKNKPYFDEETMICVSNCGCYEDGKNYKPGMEMPSKQNCESW